MGLDECLDPWGCFPKNNSNRCLLMQSCWLCLFPVYVSISLIAVVTPPPHPHPLKKKTNIWLETQITSSEILVYLISFRIEYVETTFITLLLFHDWNVRLYQQEESLQIQRESDFRCFLFLPDAELSALWGSVWNCRIGDNRRRRGPPPGAFAANTFKQPQSRLKHPRVARLRSRLQKYETLSLLR